MAKQQKLETEPTNTDTQKTIIVDHNLGQPNLSRIYVDDRFICYGLDPLVLDSGVYSVECNYSPKFKRILPLLYTPGAYSKYPASRGFRIHAGNTLKDSQGCILVGMKYQVDTEGNVCLIESKAALDKLMNEIGGKLHGIIL